MSWSVHRLGGMNNRQRVPRSRSGLLDGTLANILATGWEWRLTRRPTVFTAIYSGGGSPRWKTPLGVRDSGMSHATGAGRGVKKQKPRTGAQAPDLSICDALRGPRRECQLHERGHLGLRNLQLRLQNRKRRTLLGSRRSEALSTLVAPLSLAFLRFDAGQFRIK